VDWAVTLARKRLGRTVGNVTNAVLRNLIRLGDAPFQEDYFRSRAADDAAFLSAWYSCPLRLVRMWLNAYGREQTKSFLQASLALPPHGLRINRRHTQAAALRERSAPSAVASSSWGLALTQWPEFLDAAVEAGQATRQSFAAQAIMGDLNMDDWPEPILDTCAGRGGKTFLLREAGKEVWASDVNTFRLRQLPVEGRRLGLAVPAFYAPGQGPYPLRRAPRTVFVDAPCSGLGVLSRRPDIKWKRTAQDCRQLTMLQREILNGAAGLLPTGGFLVYVTCTLHPVENEEQTAGFLREHAEFSLILQTQTKAESNLGEFFYGVVLQKL
jgi:16S rRNA (cytosine967-C5)-methyltransferase